MTKPAMLMRGHVLGVKRAWKNYNTDGKVKLHVVGNLGKFVNFVF